MHVHVQTRGIHLIFWLFVFFLNIFSVESGISASDALKKGLRDIMTMCEHIKDTFEESENDYYASGGTGH
jgi:hypothetical protein